MSTEQQQDTTNLDDLATILDGPEGLDDLSDVEPEKQPEPEKAAEDAAPKDAPTKDDGTVPLSVLTSTRHDLQAQLEYWKGLAQKQEAQAPSEEIDFVAEPDKALSAIEQRMDQRLQQQRNQLSLAYATRTHGREAVNAAYQALQAAGDAATVQTLSADPDPYGAMVDWHKRQQVMTEIGDPAAYRERVRREILAEIQAKSTVAQAKATPQPAASLAGDPNMSSAISDDLDDLEALIGKGG